MNEQIFEEKLGRFLMNLGPKVHGFQDTGCQVPYKVSYFPNSSATDCFVIFVIYIEFNKQRLFFP